MNPRPIEFPVEGIADGDVRLRLVGDGDVAALAAAGEDPEIARYTTIPSPYGPRHARDWVLQARRGQGAGTDLQTVIVSEPGGELLGSVGINGLDPASGRCVAGYWVVSGARGRGVATRALRLLCAHAFDALGAQRIEAWIDPSNGASRAVAAAVGFRREGLMRSFMPINGVRRDMLMYSLLPDDLRRAP